MTDAPNHCDRCHADYFYAPASHRCPGEWEAECASAGAPALAPVDREESWADECVRRVMAPKRS